MANFFVIFSIFWSNRRYGVRGVQNPNSTSNCRIGDIGWSGGSTHRNFDVKMILSYRSFYFGPIWTYLDLFLKILFLSLIFEKFIILARIRQNQSNIGFSPNRRNQSNIGFSPNRRNQSNIGFSPNPKILQNFA